MVVGVGVGVGLLFQELEEYLGRALEEVEAWRQGICGEGAAESLKLVKEASIVRYRVLTTQRAGVRVWYAHAVCGFVVCAFVDARVRLFWYSYRLVQASFGDSIGLHRPLLVLL